MFLRASDLGSDAAEAGRRTRSEESLAKPPVHLTPTIETAAYPWAAMWPGADIRLRSTLERIAIHERPLHAWATACVERIAATSCDAYIAPVIEVGGTVSQHEAR